MYKEKYTHRSNKAQTEQKKSYIMTDTLTENSLLYYIQICRLIQVDRTNNSVMHNVHLPRQLNSSPIATYIQHQTVIANAMLLSWGLSSGNMWLVCIAWRRSSKLKNCIGYHFDVQCIWRLLGWRGKCILPLRHTTSRNLLLFPHMYSTGHTELICECWVRVIYLRVRVCETPLEHSTTRVRGPLEDWTTRTWRQVKCSMLNAQRNCTVVAAHARFYSYGATGKFLLGVVVFGVVTLSTINTT